MAWIKVAGAAEVKAGVGNRVFANGKELALFRVDDKIYCIDNSCPHMDGPLAEGDLEGEIVYCPWHWWPINVRTGELTYDPGVYTATFPCKVENEGVYVDME